METTSAINTIWVLVTCVFMVLMVPGLALYYGGMSRTKNVLNSIMIVLGGFAVGAVVFVLFGYSLILGNSVGGLGIIGDVTDALGIQSILSGNAEGGAASAVATAAFHLMFAGLATAIVAGAIEGRMKFGAWLLFAGLWVTLGYFPVAHWVFSFSSEDGSHIGGWIVNNLGVHDFAGGIAVHTNAGAAALALSIVLGRRKGFPNPGRPGNVPFIVLGAWLLAFGWMGFNAGSTGAMNEFAALAILNSLAALCAGLLVWLVIERLHRGATTTAGAVTGLLGGLVAVTPGADILSPTGALIVGGVGAAVAYWAVGLKARFGYDDALDAVGVHLVPGLVGSALLAFLADPNAGGGANTEFVGILYGGSWSFLGSQLIGMVAVAIYTFVISFLIATVLKKIIGLRVPEAIEVSGLDQPIHAETAYVGKDER